MALESRCKELVKIGDSLFSKRDNLMSLRQGIAELYYWHRADFTTASVLGADMAEGVMSSYAYLARQELGNLLAALLRSGEWFENHVKDEELDKKQTPRKWLEWATTVQRRAMKDRDAAFARATKEGDHDVVTFGDAVISVELMLENQSLLYRNWHTRDCVWTENYSGRPDSLHRKWRPTARQLKKRFRGNIHSEVERLCKETPDTEIDCRHIVCSREDYDYSDDRSPRAKWMSLYVDIKNEHELERSPVGWFPYVVPRFGTISGSQYGYSPCVVLPDARSADTVRMVLLEAGEKAIDPPMIGSREVFRSDMNLYAGGFTAADLESDQSLKDVFTYLSNDGRALPFGLELEQDIKQTIASSFFLNKIVLPPDMGDKTAYEIRKRVEEQVRSTTPLFEPLEQDYSAPLCETTFEALKWGGAFGPWQKWPEELQSADTEFVFQNPIKETEDEMQAQRYMEGLQLLEATRVVDPAQVAQLKTTQAFRGALMGIGWPAEWLDDEDAVEAARASMQERAEMEAGMQNVAGGATVAEQVGKAGQALQESGMM